MHDPLADFDAEIIAFLTGAGIAPERIRLETPQDREFGERSTNAAFLLAKERRMAPRALAEELANSFDHASYAFIGAVEPAGPGFLNFRLNYAAFIPQVILAIQMAGSTFGRRTLPTAERVIVEHTSVNPNKEWHIGHVRNAVLGDVVSRVLRLAGHEVEVQNYIDDTGLQAATAVHGMTRFPEAALSGEKYDHHVGRMYVKIAAELAAEAGLKERLRALEANPETDGGDEMDERTSLRARLDNIDRLKRGVMADMHALEGGQHTDMIQDILKAQLLTAFRLGIFYNLLNWESHLVQSHLFEDAMNRLQQSSHVSRPADGRYAGALVIQTDGTTAEGEPKSEVLIRSNGIPTYVGKDIAYHMWKFGVVPDRLTYVDFLEQPNGECLRSTTLSGEPRPTAPPDRVINVIAVNQSQAQESVRAGLRAAGFGEAAGELFHLAYGLVSTREGKISGRQGTSVSADGVITEAVQAAYERVREKRSQDLTDEDMRAIAESVGIGAVRYFMTQYNPMRDIVFDVGDVVSYDGNTGLYIQYALVRMFAILRKAQESGIALDAITGADVSLLEHAQEQRLAFHLGQFPEVIATVSRTLAVNLVAEYAYELATIFNQFYRDCSVMNAEPGLRESRLRLVQSVRDVLANLCAVLGVPVIERL